MKTKKRIPLILTAALALSACASAADSATAAAAAETADPCLHELFLELAGEEDSHAWLLRSVLEQL